MPLNEVSTEEEITLSDNDSDVVDIYYDKIIGQSEAAVLIVVEEKEIWIPKSQIWEADLRRQFLTVKQWVAEEKGFV